VIARKVGERVPPMGANDLRLSSAITRIRKQLREEFMAALGELRAQLDKTRGAPR
jgi:hypothetical protein